MESYTKCQDTLTLVVRSGFVIKYFRRTEVLAPQGSLASITDVFVYSYNYLGYLGLL